jgi:hypothetical protein
MPLQDSVTLKNIVQSTGLPSTSAITGSLCGLYSSLADNVEDKIRHVEGQLQDFTV